VAHAAARTQVVALAVAAAGAGVDDDDLQRRQGVADAVEFGLHLGGRHHVAVGQMAEVELDAGLEAPFQRHLVDRDRGTCAARQTRILRGMEMPGRIQMGAVVGGQRHPFGGGGLAFGVVGRRGARQHGHELGQGVLVRLVGDLRRQRGRVGQHVVLQVDRQVDEAAGHRRGLLRSAVRARPASRG
jgi:hypothetical protein